MKMVQLFGTTIQETILAFQPVHLGKKQNVNSREDRLKAIGRLVISIILIGVATYCLTSNNREIGGTLLGAIIGYWLK